METLALIANTAYAIPLDTLASLRQLERRARSRCHTAVGSSPMLTVLPMSNDTEMTATTDFESLVRRYYRSLYQFAFTLAHSEAEACDLTQQTFYSWARKGHQLRDRSKAKTWLFTTLYHEFLERKRRQLRFPHFELSAVDPDLPRISPATINELDSAAALHSLAQLDDTFQAPLALFYLEDHSYKEIADILGIPLGTVKSRISRGIAQLHQILTRDNTKSPKKGTA